MNGTDTCATRGVVCRCRNDVAVITLNRSGGSYVGTHTGFFAYGVNGYGYNGSNQALISQFGYPVALDSGYTNTAVKQQGGRAVHQSATSPRSSTPPAGSAGAC